MTGKSVRETYGDLIGRAVKAADGLTVDGFVPRKGNLLVAPLPKQEKIGSIYLPENATSEKGLCVVVKPWQGCEEFAPGDVVLTFVTSGHEIDIEGRAYRVLQTFGDFEGEILGHWRPGPGKS